MKDKINILWVSDLVTPTGFSRVSHSILANLPRDRYNIVGLGVNYRGDPHGLPFPIYPAQFGGDLYGIKRLKDVFKRHPIDVVFILNDVWIINSYLNEIKEIFGKETPPKIVIYFPVDAVGHSPYWYDNFDIVQKAYTYTEFGKKVAETACPTYNFGIIPHGISKDIFHQLFEKRNQAKEVLFANSNNKDLFSDESFTFLNANRNQPRKRLELTMEGFKLFADGKPMSVSLYMHCGNVDAKHIDVRDLASRLGIGKRLIVSGNVSGIQGVSDNKLNLIYNATDVGLNTSLGEGWGLPNMEHAITGAPQIVPDHSACGEVYKDIGILIPTHSDLMLDGGAMTVGRLVSPEAVAEAMEKIYTDKELYKELSIKTVAKFSSKEYNWETIANTWDSVFTEVAE
jgi:glycosyltransferase involved in cell wall biosynthesis